VTTSGGNGVNSNDLLAKVEYPDETSGDVSSDPSDDVSYTYDAEGEPATSTDQNGTTHTYAHDILGRTINDTVTTLGSGVDGSVRRHGTTYNSQGLPEKLTSYSDTSGSTVVNQVQGRVQRIGAVARRVPGPLRECQHGHDARDPVRLQ